MTLCIFHNLDGGLYVKIKCNMPKTKKWALWGAFIGLVIGIIETVGIVHCNWNPVEGSVVQNSDFLCRNGAYIYFPYWPFHVAGMVLGGVMDIFGYWGGYIGAIIFSVLLSVLFFYFLGSILLKFFK